MTSSSYEYRDNHLWANESLHHFELLLPLSFDSNCNCHLQHKDPSRSSSLYSTLGYSLDDDLLAVDSEDPNAHRHLSLGGRRRAVPLPLDTLISPPADGDTPPLDMTSTPRFKTSASPHQSRVGTPSPFGEDGRVARPDALLRDSSMVSRSFSLITAPSGDRAMESDVADALMAISHLLLAQVRTQLHH